MTDDPNPLAGMIAAVEDEELAGRRAAVGAIKPYAVERDNESTAKAAKDGHGLVLREFFKSHPNDLELADGEWGLKAYMGTRKLPGHKYDLVSIIENNPALFARLVSVRALLIDYDVAVKQGLESEIKRYEVPSGETQALIVRPVRV